MIVCIFLELIRPLLEQRCEEYRIKTLHNIINDLQKIDKYKLFSNSEIKNLLISIVIYIKRFTKKYNGVYDLTTIFRILFIISDKCIHDSPFVISSYNTIFGIEKSKLINLEMKMLEVLQYDLFISKKEYKKMKKIFAKYKDEFLQIQRLTGKAK